MDMPEKTGYEAILNIVRDWPATWRFVLVQDVLKTLAQEVETVRPRHNTLEKALGLLATDGPFRADAEIQQWLDKTRLDRG